jgi:hypothetical protein
LGIVILRIIKEVIKRLWESDGRGLDTDDVLFNQVDEYPT